MTDTPPLPPPGELDLWFAAGFRVAAAAQRRPGWLYGRTALDLAAARLVQLYRVGLRYGWTLQQFGQGGHAEACLDAVTLRVRDGLPTDVLHPGWRDGLLCAVDMRLQRQQVATYRQPGRLLLPPSGRVRWPVGRAGASPLQVSISAVHGWEFTADGARLAVVVADVDDTGVDEVAALAVRVLAGRLPGPAGHRPRTPYGGSAPGGRGLHTATAVIDETTGAAR